MIEISEKRAVELVTRLMEIPGPSGQELAVSQTVEQTLLAAGVPESCIRRDKAHQRSPFGGETGNLIVKLPGNRRGPRVLLSAHMDTVPLCVGCRPQRRQDKIISSLSSTALGADDRAGVAVVLTAILEAIEKDLPYLPTTLCFFIQEEVGLQGSRLLQANLLGKPKLAFNFDGGMATKMTIGATSGVRMNATFKGIASHAGIAPADGANAITAASLAIARLQNDGWLGAVKKGKFAGTSNIGVLQGGNATNVVADSALLRAEARSHNRDFRDRIVQSMVDAFAWGASQVKNLKGDSVTVDIETRIDYEAYKLDKDEPSVVAATKAAKALGLDAIHAISDGGLDANWLYQHDIPAVSLGCGQRNVHTTNEYLDVPDYLNACRIATWLIQNADMA
jgi:tripeptide aminopeptidase